MSLVPSNSVKVGVGHSHTLLGVGTYLGIIFLKGNVR